MKEGKAHKINQSNPAEKQKFFQPRLTVGPVDDVYEKEADAVADQIMRMPADKNQNSFFTPKSLSVTTLVQSKCAACEEEERSAQRKAISEIIQRDEAEEVPSPDFSLTPPSLLQPSTEPDFLAMRQPFINRSIFHLWHPESALQVWNYNFNFFRRFGFAPDRAATLSNFTAPFFIDSQLKADNPTWWEISDQEMNTTTFNASLPVLEFGPDFSPVAPGWFRTIFGGGVQRKCADCEEEKNIQRKENGNSEAPSVVNDAINSGGQPLDGSTRSFMENRFGYDFGQVKIHNNSLAAKSAQSINALAYTSGNSIVFNEGQYSPHTQSGKTLLAHELTHVVQQNSSLQKKPQRNGVAQMSESKQVVQRYYTFAPDPRPKGTLVHNTVLPMFAESNADLFIEVRIPGATKKDIDKGVKGIADFYKADITEGRSRTIGITFDNEPGFLTKSKRLQGGGKDYSHNKHSAPKGGIHKPRVSNLDAAPTGIEIGDLKPGGSAEVTLGLGQVSDYKQGVTNTASDINTYLAANRDQHDGRTKNSWHPGPANMKSLTIPPKLEYPTGGISPGDLALYGSEGKIPIERYTGLTGKMYVYKDATGIWSYEWIPDNIPATTGSGKIDTVLNRLNNDVIPAITQTKAGGTVATKRKALSGEVKRSKTNKPAKVQRKDKKFDSSDWQKKRYGPWEDEAKKFLGDDKEVKKAKVAEGVVQVNKRIGNKLNVPTEVKERGKGLGKIKHWKNFGKAYGFLREKFDFVYVKIKGVIDKVKAKVKRLARTSAGSSFGNWVKAVAKVIFKIFKVVGSWVIHQTVDKLMGSLQEGISNNINKLIEKLLPEEAEKKLAEFEALKQKYQAIIDEKEEEIIKLFFGDKLDLFEKLDKWESIASTVSTIVDVIKWGIRIVACASPPAIGCLWNLAVSAIEYLFSKLIQTCWFTKEAVGPVIEHVSMVKEFPNKLASEIVIAANKYIPIPSGMEPLFAPIPKVDLNQFKYECGAGGDGGSSQISGDRKAILDLAAEIGDEKMLAFVEMAKNKGAGPWVLLTKERIELMKEGLKQVSVDDLKKLAESSAAETPVEFEKFFEDIKQYTKKEKKVIKEWKDNASGTKGDGEKGGGNQSSGVKPADKAVYGPPPATITGNVSSYFAAAVEGGTITNKTDREGTFDILLRADIVDGTESYTVIVQGISVKLHDVDDHHVYFENQKAFSVYYNGETFVYFKSAKIFKVSKEHIIYH